MSAVCAERHTRPARPAVGASVHPGLRIDESADVLAGHWFATLSEPLRQAILSRARVRKVATGTPLAQRGETTASWIGVVRGAARLGTPLADGRCFTLDFIGPGHWFGDIAAVGLESVLTVWRLVMARDSSHDKSAKASAKVEPERVGRMHARRREPSVCSQLARRLQGFKGRTRPAPATHSGWGAGQRVIVKTHVSRHRPGKYCCVWSDGCGT